MENILAGVAWIAAGLVVATSGLFAAWRVRSAVRRWRAQPRPLRSVQARIWHDPGDVSRLDLAAGPGGHEGGPVAPFAFLAEHTGGSQPCLSVRDARGLTWRVKWGGEVHAEALATRLAWAAGYFVEITYYVADGVVEGAPATLQRAAGCLDDRGRFTHARFELDEDGVIKHFDEHSWAWNDNPFVGTHELNGLKIVMMWLSNWDAKDVRDVARGSNTAIFEYPAAAFREARYLITDWGGALGRWGSIVTRGRWDCTAFEAENPAFIQGVEGDLVRFGYTGQRTGDIAAGIRVSDVQWLMRTLHPLTEAQIADAVRASGGTADETRVFARALRDRLDRLAHVAGLVASAHRAAANA